MTDYGVYRQLRTTPEDSKSAPTAWDGQGSATLDLRQELGHGAFGQVFSGWYKGEQVAVKTLRLEADTKQHKRQSFAWEYQRLEGVSHPYIVSSRAPLIERDGLLCMVLEYCLGGDLQHAIFDAAGDTLPLDVIWRYALQITCALRHVHERGLVHKDLKTENILLTAEDHRGLRTCKLADLGVSQADTAVQHATEVTPDVVLRGIKDLWWGAPEEAGCVFSKDDAAPKPSRRHAYHSYHSYEIQAGTVSTASDVFALGLVMSHMVLGKPPRACLPQGFDVSFDHWLSALRSGEAAQCILSAIPAAHPLRSIIAGCLQHKPVDRLTAEECERRLLQPDLASACVSDPAQLALSLLMHHQLLQLHSSSHVRQKFVPSRVTEQEGLSPSADRAADTEAETETEAEADAGTAGTATGAGLDTGMSGSRDAELHTATAWLKEWSRAEESDNRPRVAVLLGDGGTGKTLVSHVMAAEVHQSPPPLPTVPIPLPTPMRTPDSVDDGGGPHVVHSESKSSANASASDNDNDSASGSASGSGRGSVTDSESRSVTPELDAADSCEQNKAVLYVLVRPGLPRWSHSALRDGLRQCLEQHYGLSSGMVQALSRVRWPRIIFWVDAYDELRDDVQGAVQRNLPQLLGFNTHLWPHASLVVTSRRHVVASTQLQERFGLEQPSVQQLSGTPSSSVATAMLATTATATVAATADTDAIVLPEEKEVQAQVSALRPSAYGSVIVRYMLPFGAAEMKMYLKMCGFADDDVVALLRDRRARGILENPFVLRLFTFAHQRSQNGVAAAVAAGGGGASGGAALDVQVARTRVGVYAAAVEAWCGHLLEGLQDSMPVLEALCGGGVAVEHNTTAEAAETKQTGAPGTGTTESMSHQRSLGLPALLHSFIHFASSVALHMFADVQNSTTLPASIVSTNPWIHADEVVVRSAQSAYTRTHHSILSERDYINLRLTSWHAVMAECPLQRKGMDQLSFVHKSMRDYFIAHAMVKTPFVESKETQHPLMCTNITVDSAVQRLAAELVDVNRAADLGWDVPTLSSSAAQVLSSDCFEAAAWKLVEATRRNKPWFAVAAANALTILNTAGVPLSARLLSRACLGDPAWDKRHPFMDLGGGMLHRIDLREAQLGGVRLQQAFLNEAQLTGAQLQNAVFGELPSFPLDAAAFALAVSPDGHSLFSALRDDTVHHLSSTTGARVGVFSGHVEQINALAVSPDGMYLYSGSEDATVIQWHVASGKRVTVYETESAVSSLSISSDGMMLFAGTQGETDVVGLRQVDVSSGKMVRDIRPHGENQNKVYGSKVDPQGRIVYVSDSARLYEAGVWTNGDFQVTGWYTDTGEQAVTVWRGEYTIGCLEMTPDGNYLLGSVMTPTSSMFRMHGRDVWRGPAGLPKTQDLNVGNNSVFVWRLGSSQPQQPHRIIQNVGAVQSMCLSHDGAFLYVGAEAGQLSVCAVGTGEVLRQLQGHTLDVNGVAVAARADSGGVLYSASSDATIRQWSLSAQELVRVDASVRGHTHPIMRIAHSQERSVVVTADGGHMGNQCVRCEWTGAAASSASSTAAAAGGGGGGIGGGAPALSLQLISRSVRPVFKHIGRVDTRGTHFVMDSSIPLGPHFVIDVMGAKLLLRVHSPTHVLGRFPKDTYVWRSSPLALSTRDTHIDNIVASDATLLLLKQNAGEELEDYLPSV